MRLQLTLALACLTLSSCAVQAQPSFSVSFPSSAYSGPFTGRVVVYLAHSHGTAAHAAEPRFGPDWADPQPMISAKFSGISPNQPMVLSDSNAVEFPGKLAELPEGDYDVQAVVDLNLGRRQIGASPGNLYSDVVTRHLGPSTHQMVSITCGHVVQAPEFKNTKDVREFRVQSVLLTRWYNRPTFVQGAVVLPDEWFEDQSRKFPVYYEVPGFGGDHYRLSGHESYYKAATVAGTPFILVQLDPNVPTGHCVFADSANNGPWGEALTAEYIPALEKEFRGLGEMRARYVGGHSSGGWASLWLQVAYPDVFGGVWSTSPDPVDFHQFQLTDIYRADANMFFDKNGKLLPLARQGEKPWLFAKPFSDMERPIRGEQLGSFEAVFSPRGADGEPVKLWNRDTGAIDPSVADAWKKYDIALKLKNEWSTLGPKLKGKLHVFCGDIDTFYLDGAVRRLKEELKELGSDAEVEIVPGDHFTMMSPELRQKIDLEMAAQFKRSGG